MKYEIGNILREVRIALDENITSNQIFETDANTLTLDDIIRQKISHGVCIILESAPSNMLDSGIDFSGSEVLWNSGCSGIGSGRIRLPDDFLRLLVFRMSDWRIPVTETITDSDPEYLKQVSKYPGIRGNTTHPVCALTRDGTGKVLEFYSCRGGSNVGVESARYISIPNTSNDTIDIPERLFIPCLYQIAGLTALTYKDEHAQALFSVAKGFIDTGSLSDKKQ